MQKKLSNWLVRKETAINHLYDADRWLTTGEFLHRVPDDVKMTIHGLIEGWLEECDIEPDFRDGWRSMLYQFYKFAPDRLFGKASDILLEVTLLEGGGLVDDFSEMEKDELSFDEWVARLRGIVLEAKSFMRELEMDLLEKGKI